MSDQKVHAALGASSAKRWKNCPGSINFIASQPDFLLDTTSEFAEEGTEAHALAEKCLLSGEDVPDPIEDEPVQIYLNEVRSHLNGFTDLFVEQRIQINEEMFGTNDAAVVDWLESTLWTFDYKHGVGVPVGVEENEQLMYYALGFLKKFDPLGTKLTRVVICVVQPRCIHPDGPVRRWETTPDRLKVFETQLLLAAAMTKRPDAPLNAGSHCRFCPAVAVCPAYRKAVTEGMNNPALAHALKTAEALGSYKAALNRVIFKTLTSGMKVEGFKLVQGTKHRKWVDLPRVKMLLANQDECWDKEIKSPAQIEKILGKEFVACHSIKPVGDPVVAFANDKRKEWSKAGAAFADIPDEE